MLPNPDMTGNRGRSWLYTEPAPGHFLVHRPDTPPTDDGAPLTWFLISYGAEPLRIVLRGISPDTDPETVDDMDFHGILLEVEVPEDTPVEDIAQLPGLYARAVITGAIMPATKAAPQWEAALPRLVTHSQRARGHREGEAVKRREKTEEALRKHPKRGLRHGRDRNGHRRR